MRSSTNLGRPPQGRRHAFTLVELLVVVTIIAVLASLAVVAAMKLVGSQKSSNSNQTLQKTQRELDKRFKAEMDEADRTFAPLASQQPSVYQGLMVMAGGDGERAKVIWRKLCIVRAFPTAYQEILQFGQNSTWYVFAGQYNINPGPRQGYVTALSASTGTPSWPPPPPPPGQFRPPPGGGAVPPPAGENFTNTLPPPPNAEGGACLLIILSSSTRGAGMDTSTLGSISQADTDGDGLTEVVDGWGTPVRLYRGPTSNFTRLPLPPSNVDPLDPTGRLVDPTWNNQQNWTSQQGVFWFEMLFHSVHTFSGQTWVPTPYYTTPVVVSAGPNQKFGLTSSVWGVPPNLRTPQTAPYPIGWMSPGPEWLGTTDANNNPNYEMDDDTDNLYSWPPGK